jgi:hypothetical protein
MEGARDPTEPFPGRWLMWYLYLDESGDLGFDFFAKKPSKFFTVCILALQGVDNNRCLLAAVKKTRLRKLSRSRSAEMKGSHMSLEMKRYFYNLVTDLPFELYALTLNKRRVYDELTRRKDRVYNFIARNVLDHLPIEQATTRVEFIIDKSKSKREIADFNGYITRQLEGRIDPRVPLDIYHHRSAENAGLQVVDLFAWGIFRKYERADWAWYNVFREKIRYDDQYL